MYTRSALVILLPLLSAPTFAYLDCGGGRAPPKTTVPGCPGYVDPATAIVEPTPTDSYDNWDIWTTAAAASYASEYYDEFGSWLTMDWSTATEDSVTICRGELCFGVPETVSGAPFPDDPLTSGFVSATSVASATGVASGSGLSTITTAPSASSTAYSTTIETKSAVSSKSSLAKSTSASSSSRSATESSTAESSTATSASSSATPTGNAAGRIFPMEGLTILGIALAGLFLA